LQERGFKTLLEKLKVVEGSKELIVILSEYEMIQTKNKGMADGILLGMREAKEVFNIGSGRWGRIAKGVNIISSKCLRV
jgi:hypothetical protein